MSIIRLKKRVNPFVMIDKNAINDSRLSWKARGILACILSKKDDWSVNIQTLADAAPDGITAVRSAMKELEKFGYARLVPVRDEKGRVCGREWLILESPENEVSDDRNAGFMNVGKNRNSEKPKFGKTEIRKTCISVEAQNIENRQVEQAGGGAELGFSQKDIIIYNNTISNTNNNIISSRKKNNVAFPLFSDGLKTADAVSRFAEFLKTHADGKYKAADAAKYVADALEWATNTPQGKKARYASWETALAGWVRRDYDRGKLFTINGQNSFNSKGKQTYVNTTSVFKVLTPEEERAAKRELSETLKRLQNG